MAIPKGRSRRKITGGLYKPFRKRKKRELGRYPVLTTIGQRKAKKERVFGGNFKLKLISDEHINVVDKNGKVRKAKIIRLIENNANRDFLRKKIISKGAIVETDIGKVEITNRPSQEGVINGKLIE